MCKCVAVGTCWHRQWRQSAAVIGGNLFLLQRRPITTPPIRTVSRRSPADKIKLDTHTHALSIFSSFSLSLCSPKHLTEKIPSILNEIRRSRDFKFEWNRVDVEREDADQMNGRHVMPGIPSPETDISHQSQTGQEREAGAITPPAAVPQISSRQHPVISFAYSNCFSSAGCLLKAINFKSELDGHQMTLSRSNLSIEPIRVGC